MARDILENLTHTLIGWAAGESLAQSTRAPGSGLTPEVRRSLFVAIAAIGGNLPDLDLAWSFGRGNKLGYLLQHRGYTHTVVGCLVLAGLLYLAVEFRMRRRHLRPTPRDRLVLLAVAVFGTLLHLAMDSLNSYGVHPFWPAENRWFYGDSLFIVEPLFWVCSAPLFFLARSVLARVLVGLSLVAAWLGAFAVHGLHPGWLLGFAVGIAALLTVGRKVSTRAASLISLATMACVTGVFVLAGNAAARQIRTIAAADFPGGQLIDHVLTPVSTNPVCWDVILLETSGDRYTARHGLLSIAPGLEPASRCSTVPGRRGAGTTAPMTTVAAAELPGMHWLGEFSMPRRQLADLVAGHCEAQELMQFVRAPFATEYRQAWVLGDLRFDQERGLGMSEIELRAPGREDCSYHVPWVPPRANLLR
jgi:inner membrane protein